MKLHTIVVANAALLALVACGGSGNQPVVTRLSGQWNASAYQIHEHGATTSTIWLTPLTITPDGRVVGRFSVEEYPGGSESEAGDFAGTAKLSPNSTDEQLTLNFPPRSGTTTARTLSATVRPDLSCRTASGEATGWGFGSDPERCDYIFGMDR